MRDCGHEPHTRTGSSVRRNGLHQAHSCFHLEKICDPVSAPPRDTSIHPILNFDVCIIQYHPSSVVACPPITRERPLRVRSIRPYPGGQALLATHNLSVKFLNLESSFFLFYELALLRQGEYHSKEGKRMRGPTV